MSAAGDVSCRHRVEVEGSERVFECAEDQSILSALAPVHRRTIRCGCRGGGCGVCKIEIVEGEYESGCMSEAHVCEDERARGVVLACRVYPRSQVRLRVLPGASSFSQMTTGTIASAPSTKNAAR